MTDRLAEVLPMQDITEEGTLRRLTGDTGVFVGDADSLAAAKTRWEAMKAVEEGRATAEQRTLLQDLDRVMQGATTPVAPPPPAPMPRYAPPPVQPVQRVATPVGMPAPPRHSRNRR